MRILLIEDESRIRAFLARGFGADGFTVDEASDGETGLARALAEDYDLVVLDLLLPRRPGLSVIHQLALHRPELPVLVLSARSDLRTKLESFALGASDYVSKPFSLDELLARAKVQLRRRQTFGSDGNLLHVGSLVLDLARHAACVDGEAADLTAREFALLYHLALHAGEVISRERILSEVWGYHFDPCSNVVDVCVRRLRKKLGPHAPIETVRNAGYRLSAR
jgi:two-component system copper resistance phosphate regulon response regulator CusR